MIGNQKWLNTITTFFTLRLSLQDCNENEEKVPEDDGKVILQAVNEPCILLDGEMNITWYKWTFPHHRKQIFIVTNNNVLYIFRWKCLSMSANQWKCLTCCKDGGVRWDGVCCWLHVPFFSLLLHRKSRSVQGQGLLFSN